MVNIREYIYTQIVDTNSIIQIHVNDVEPIVGVHLWWFLDSAKLGLKGLSPNHLQGKSLSHL